MSLPGALARGGQRQPAGAELAGAMWCGPCCWKGFGRWVESGHGANPKLQRA